MKSGVFSQAQSAGVYHLTPAQEADIPKLAADAKRQYRVIDLSACQTRDQALILLGQDLAFPDWYGANLDALSDCLKDESWRPKHGLIARISGLARLHQIDSDACSALIEIFSDASHPAHSEDPSALWCLIDTPLPGSKPLPKA